MCAVSSRSAGEAGPRWPVCQCSSALISVGAFLHLPGCLSGPRPPLHSRGTQEALEITPAQPRRSDLSGLGCNSGLGTFY